jgi:hypothetical protein
MKEETIRNVVGLVVGDIFVQVDIKYQPLSPVDSVEERLALSKTNADLGLLAHQIEEDIRGKMRAFFSAKTN